MESEDIDLVPFYNRALQLMCAQVPPLFHFTDFDGLHGILKHNCMWATYRKSLNDRADQTFGHELFENILEKRVGELLPIGWAKPSRHFVTCFCETHDSLAMWQSYANRGGGYCIEFDPSIVNIEPSSAKRNWIFKLRYGVDQPEVVQLLSDLCDLFYSTNQDTRDECLSLADIASMTLKHLAFSHEREWRILTVDPDPAIIDFHLGHSDIKAHVDCFLKPPGTLLPVRRIIYGPTLRNDGTIEDVLHLMLQKYAHPKVTVERCEIPLQ
jgi:hypothetical protein